MPAQKTTTTGGKFDSVIDVTAVHPRNLVSSEEISKQLVGRIFAQFGQIFDVLPWESKQGRPHFYIEFGSPEGALRARAAALREFACFTIANDLQHQKRFASLSSSSIAMSTGSIPLKSTRSGIRYSPYPTPTSSHVSSTHQANYASGVPFRDLEERPESSLSILGGELAGPSLPLHPPPLYPSHYDKGRPRREEDELPIIEHQGPLIDASRGRSGGTFANSYPSASTSMPLQQSPDQFLALLSELREKKVLESGEPNHSYTQHSIHSKFDFREHILSGQFLVSDPKVSIDNQRPFKLTALQAYFADIYGNLQSELSEMKQGYKKQMFQLEQQKIRCQHLTDEAADERSVRRETETQLEDLRRSLQVVTAASDAHRRTADQYAFELEDARKEIENLRGTLEHIQSIIAGPVQTSTTQPQS